MATSIYKTEEGKKDIIALYDQQLKNIGIDYEDVYIDTRFGKTHVIKAGNANGKPLLFLHGGNSTAPYSLGQNTSLLENFQVFAPDIIGHPGKSAETVLSPKTLEYGEWASDVIDALGFKEMDCMGGSFGGGVLMKLMCVSPEKISKAVLVVPSGIANVSTAKIMFSMGIPMIIYILTGKDKWLKKAIIPMALHEKYIDQDTLDMVRGSFQHVKVKSGMPSNVKASEMKNYTAPTLLLAAEKDVLFPGRQVIEKAKKIISNLEAHLLENCGHMYAFPEKNKEYVHKKIMNFL